MSLTLKTILLQSYDDFAKALEAELQPVGTLEVMVAGRIIDAERWLHRLRSLPDPNHPDYERIRHRNLLALRRDTAELRQLQADRFLKSELELDLPGIARVKDVAPHLKNCKTEPKPATPAKTEPEKLNNRTQTPPPASADIAQGRILRYLNQQEEAYRALTGRKLPPDLPKAA